MLHDISEYSSIQSIISAHSLPTQNYVVIVYMYIIVYNCFLWSAAAAFYQIEKLCVYLKVWTDITKPLASDSPISFQDRLSDFIVISPVSSNGGWYSELYVLPTTASDTSNVSPVKTEEFWPQALTSKCVLQ